MAGISSSRVRGRLHACFSGRATRDTTLAPPRAAGSTQWPKPMAREKSSEGVALDPQTQPDGLGGGDRISNSFEDAPLLHRMMAPWELHRVAARSLSKTGENAATTLSVTTGKAA